MACRGVWVCFWTILWCCLMPTVTEPYDGRLNCFDIDLKSLVALARIMKIKWSLFKTKIIKLLLNQRANGIAIYSIGMHFWDCSIVPIHPSLFNWLVCHWQEYHPAIMENIGSRWNWMFQVEHKKACERYLKLAEVTCCHYLRIRLKQKTEEV